MDVKLVIEQGKTRTKALHLRKDEGVIGREAGCAVRIPSAEVSRRHCVLRKQDGYLTVEDLKSSNGTQLNGEDVTGVQVVRPGDRLRVGPVTFIVEYQLTPEAIDRLLRGEVGDMETELEVIEEGTDNVDVVDEAAPQLDALEEIQPELLDEVEPVTAQEEGLDELELIEPGEYQLPETDELRNILTGLDEDEEPPPKKGKRK
jgi:pSer/pThr/pTyr-binding forkhead associated (FHA) protein